jgi:ADP-glucose pyrophosphorylase
VVGQDCEIIRTIIDEGVTVGSGCHIGGEEEITVIGQGASLSSGMRVQQGASIQPDCEFINDACETGNEVSL